MSSPDAYKRRAAKANAKAEAKAAAVALKPVKRKRRTKLEMAAARYAAEQVRYAAQLLAERGSIPAPYTDPSDAEGDDEESISLAFDFKVEAIRVSVSVHVPAHVLTPIETQCFLAELHGHPMDIVRLADGRVTYREAYV